MKDKKSTKKQKRLVARYGMQTAGQQAEELSVYAYSAVYPEAVPTPEDPFSKRNLTFMKELLAARVKPDRFLHSVSVAKTAAKVAKAYGCDAKQARMAGLLHDWDKELLPVELEKRVNDFHLDVSGEVLTEMPWILHGQTAAAVLREQFSVFGEEVFASIERHTVPVPGMSDLDMIVYVSDKVEPLHEIPEYRRLYKQIGKISLEDLFFEVQKEQLAFLIRVNRPLVLESVPAWNYYCARKRSYKKKHTKK